MLESGDFVSIHFQDTPRFKKPVGIYWLQAAAVKTLSLVEDREIWAYRIPSLLGAMLAAGGLRLGRGGVPEAGPRLGGRGDAGGELLALHRGLHRRHRRGAVRGDHPGHGGARPALSGGARRAAGRPAGKALFWAGLALAILVKGPIGPMVVGLTLVGAVHLGPAGAHGWRRSAGAGA